MAEDQHPDESKHKLTLRQLILGREVPLEKARDALGWLGRSAEATVIETSNGNVRLRVPVHPRSATDLHAGAHAGARG
jgi:hypothetical protein